MDFCSSKTNLNNNNYYFEPHLDYNNLNPDCKPYSNLSSTGTFLDLDTQNEQQIISNYAMSNSCFKPNSTPNHNEKHTSNSVYNSSNTMPHLEGNSSNNSNANNYYLDKIYPLYQQNDYQYNSSGYSSNHLTYSNNLSKLNSNEDYLNPINCQQNNQNLNFTPNSNFFNNSSNSKQHLSVNLSMNMTMDFKSIDTLNQNNSILNTAQPYDQVVNGVVHNVANKLVNNLNTNLVKASNHYPTTNSPFSGDQFLSSYTSQTFNLSSTSNYSSNFHPAVNHQNQAYYHSHSYHSSHLPHQSHQPLQPNLSHSYSSESCNNSTTASNSSFDKIQTYSSPNQLYNDQVSIISQNSCNTNCLNSSLPNLSYDSHNFYNHENYYSNNSINNKNSSNLSNSSNQLNYYRTIETSIENEFNSNNFYPKETFHNENLINNSYINLANSKNLNEYNFNLSTQQNLANEIENLTLENNFDYENQVNINSKLYSTDNNNNSTFENDFNNYENYKKKSVKSKTNRPILRARITNLNSFDFIQKKFKTSPLVPYRKSYKQVISFTAKDNQKIINTHYQQQSNDCNVCFICNKSYARPSTLKTHLRTHSGERPFRCTTCFKSFSQAANLTAHLRTHSGEKPFQCYICLRRFSQSSSVTTHMRTHSGERPYKCILCRKAFSDSSTLTKHLRIHSGEKPYQCLLCFIKFSQSGNLNRHMKVHENAT